MVEWVLVEMDETGVEEIMDTTDQFLALCGCNLRVQLNVPAVRKQASSL